MSSEVVHILLLDGKILCVELKYLRPDVLVKHLCVYLHLKSSETLGLVYKDSRGIEQWLDPSKLISDHEITPYDNIIHLVLKIRFIPHHITDQEVNVHQLILAAVRLLRQDWFLAQPEIHSQLLALYLLSLYGMELSDSDIYSLLIKDKLSIIDPFTKDNCFDCILKAYKIYVEKFDNVAEFSLKFLQLMMQFPIFNSRLFVISNSKGEKYLFGVNSVEMTLFHLERYHEPIKKVLFKNVDSVMRRDLKIIIGLQDKPRSQRSAEDNEIMVFYALSTHQSDSLYSEIEACWDKCKTSPISCTINQLMKNNSFKERFGQWLYNKVGDLHYADYHTKVIDIHLIPTDVKDHVTNEQEFGEVKVYDSDIYMKLSQVTNNKKEHIGKPIPDIEQLCSEEETLKTLLNEKMNQLAENFLSEKKLTGIMPCEYTSYFPSGSMRFIRNNNPSSLGRKSHKGCAAEIKNKWVNGDTIDRSMAIPRENFSFHSTKNMKGSMSPVILGKMKTSHSVSDLRFTDSPSNMVEHSPLFSTKKSPRPSISPASSGYSNLTSVRHYTSKNSSPLITKDGQRYFNTNPSQSFSTITSQKRQLTKKGDLFDS